jgi:uncharacterized protein (DUF427 family)
MGVVNCNALLGSIALKINSLNMDFSGMKRKEGIVMPKAIWNGVVLAESNNTVVVEGNQYFPPDAVKQQFLKASDTHTTCPWKGVASYYDVEVDGKVNRDAAWYYPNPKEAARQIKDYVAFWHGVQVEV